MVSQTKKSKKTTSRTASPKKTTSRSTRKRKSTRKKNAKGQRMLSQEFIFFTVFLILAAICAIFLAKYWINND